MTLKQIIIIGASILLVGLAGVGSWLYINNRELNIREQEAALKHTEQSRSNTINTIQDLRGEEAVGNCTNEVKNRFADAAKELEGATSEEYKIFIDLRQQELDNCYKQYQ